MEARQPTLADLGAGLVDVAIGASSFKVKRLSLDQIAEFMQTDLLSAIRRQIKDEADEFELTGDDRVNYMLQSAAARIPAGGALQEMALQHLGSLIGMRQLLNKAARAAGAELPEDVMRNLLVEENLEQVMYVMEQIFGIELGNVLTPSKESEPEQPTSPPTVEGLVPSAGSGTLTGKPSTSTSSQPTDGDPNKSES